MMMMIKIKIMMITTNLMLICIYTHSVAQPSDTDKYCSMLLITKGQWVLTLLSAASKYLLYSNDDDDNDDDDDAVEPVYVYMPPP